LVIASNSVAANSDRYFEDYVCGSVSEYGPVTVDASEANDFKRQFGPGFWGDQEEGNTRAQGAASEWHVLGLMMRLFVIHFLPKTTSIASPGVDELRWLKSVRVGDALRIRVTVFETRRSRSKPDRGMVRAFIEMFNQDGELVLTLKSMNLIRCRQVGSTESPPAPHET